MSHRRCLFCTSLYKGKSNFVNHVKRKHIHNLNNIDSEELKEIKYEWVKMPLIEMCRNNGQFKCDICEHRFNQLKNLKVHIQKNHIKLKSAKKCSYKRCQSTFVHKNNFIAHLKQVHMKCSECCTKAKTATTAITTTTAATTTDPTDQFPKDPKEKSEKSVKSGESGKSGKTSNYCKKCNAIIKNGFKKWSLSQ